MVLSMLRIVIFFVVLLLHLIFPVLRFLDLRGSVIFLVIFFCVSDGRVPGFLERFVSLLCLILLLFLLLFRISFHLGPSPEQQRISIFLIPIPSIFWHLPFKGSPPFFFPSSLLLRLPIDTNFSVVFLPPYVVTSF